MKRELRRWEVAGFLFTGALGTLLSGSGSAVFGLFDDQSAAAAAAEALKKTWPWVFVARPV